jgi:hypothetical protein
MAIIQWVFRIFRPLRTLSVAAVFAASLSLGQAPAASTPPPQTIEEALHQMSDKAAVIFAGRVIAVRQQSGDGIASGFVEVQFRVDQAIRGCTTGTSYTLHEWPGLWSGGAQRYRVGQTLLMFLHAPGASGLSSPISGMDGAIPIHGANSSLVATGSSVQQGSVVDLRWIAAKLLRPTSYRAQSLHFNHRAARPRPFVVSQPVEHAAASKLLSENILSTDAPIETATPVGQTSSASVFTQQSPIQPIIEMLQSWQKAPDAAR